MYQDLYRQLLSDLVEKLMVTGSVEARVTGWTDSEFEYLDFCLAYKVVTVHDVRELVKGRLCRIGRENYLWATVEPVRNRRYIDRCLSPIALSYALQEGEFLPEEKAKLVQSDGSPLSKFIVEEGKKLLDVVMRHVCQVR